MFQRGWCSHGPTGTCDEGINIINYRDLNYNKSLADADGDDDGDGDEENFVCVIVALAIATG